MPSNRNSLTLQQKIKIIDELSSGTSNADICRKYRLATSTVSTIWKNKTKIKETLNSNVSKLKRIRKPVNKEVDQALLQWFKQKRTQNVPISGPILQEKAEEFSKLLSPSNETSSCSKSWIDRFKKRYHISSSKIHGEGRSVSAETTQHWLENVWPTLRRGYSDSDIFNGDETGLFYKMVPNQTLKFQKEKCQGGKKSKDRITVFVCANMTGTEKRKLLVIGKSKTPRCFKSCKTLPVNYTANKKAWVTSEIFEKEIRSWDHELQKQKRKILLMIDNCPAHPTIENLSAIKVVFLPPNTTAALQPMDQGIIACFKHYKKMFLCRMISCLDQDKDLNFSLLDGILTINTAWNRVSQKTIMNCYKHAGFLPNSESEFDDDDEIPLSQWILKHKNSEVIDEEDCNSLRDWAIKNDLVKGPLTSDILDAFQQVDDCLVTCEYPSEIEIAAAVQETQFTEEPESEEDEEPESTFEPPTTQEVFSAMKTVSSYLEFNSFQSDVKQKFDFIQRRIENSLLTKSVTQKMITDYFK